MKDDDFSNFVHYMRMSLLLDVGANIVKYATLLGGIASVVGEDPNFATAILAGIGYVFSGYIGDLASVTTTNASLIDTESKLKGIESKLEDIGVRGEKNGSKRIRP